MIFWKRYYIKKKKEGVGCCEPPERTEEGSNTITVFWRFFAKEIAAMLKITPGNVKVLSYRAKKELKEYLTKEEGR